ncbi:NADH-quinone oxidoreductase subunit F [Chloroflexota bacterium]
MPQKRIVLQYCGIINPNDINSNLEHDGFKALQKVNDGMTSAQVIEELKISGLRGRGGAGFPTGLKCEMAANATGKEKYALCNADEGEVGTFKDRYILTNDPFSLIEGLAITALTIGAKQGYIYLRSEYHYMLDMINSAIRQANEKGFLKGVNIEVREGAGAYICGEESALMESIEGKRGEVRPRPPFPPTQGLRAMPTTINNVETLMNIPRIVLHGGEWFSKEGTDQSKGTKVFSVAGDVDRPGVYEMTLGSKLSELVVELAGAKNINLVQIGGATGRIIPASMLDTKLSFETILGAGAITVFNKNRDVIDIIHRTLEFLAEESCGKCSPCREGTTALVTILDKFANGQGTNTELSLLEELSSAMMLSSLCGLGQAAPNPVLDSLEHFRGAFEERIRVN